MDNVNHVMIDIETAGKSENAIVLTIAAVDIFNPENHIYLKLNSYEQHEQFKRSMDVDTMFWWFSQSKEIIDENWFGLQGQVSDLYHWLGRFGFDVRVWANGVDFDLPIVKSLLKDYGIPVYWQYYNQRCMRFLKDHPKFCSMFNEIRERKHSALDDALFQAKIVRKFLEN